MKTIYLNDSETLYIETPDVLRAFGGDIINVCDDSETAHRVVITEPYTGLELTAFFYRGVAQVHALPFLREIAKGEIYASVKNVQGGVSLVLNVAVYDTAGEQLNTVETVTAAALYVAAQLGKTYSGTRYITYNPNTPDGQAFIFLAEHGNTVNFFNETTQVAQQVRGNNGLTRVNLDSFFVGTPVNSVIRTSGAQAINGDNLITGETLKIYIEIDYRAENVVFLRWLDNIGLQHYRAFTFGTRTTATTTGKRYTPAQTVNITAANALYFEPIADKDEVVSVTFGDDAIKEQYFEEIKTLNSAPKVEMYDTQAGAWLRVVVADANTVEKRREHVFNFNATAILPKNPSITW